MSGFGEQVDDAAHRGGHVQLLHPVPAIMATGLRRINKGALMGFCDLRIAAWSIVLHDCKWFRTNNGEWIGMPSVRYETRDGKTVYKDLIEFTDKEVASRFQAAALAAVRKIS